ncbi:redox-sensitive transcriptional activator SoxR, partial [Vibrio anguillarum]|nr:redox-sensitive transcriptional activator SoxR [Vibrio anguillarum]
MTKVEITVSRNDYLTIGQLAERSGVAASAL